MRPYVNYEEGLYNRLRDPAYALGYLQACLEDKDERVFLIGLRDVAQAYGGLTKLARAAGMSREHLYDVLSKKGNPEFLSLRALLDALGFKLSIESKKPSKVRRAA